MVFLSGVFLFLFLPVALTVYYSPICKKIFAKNVWLLLASLGFYAWGEPVYVFLMLFSICMNWLFGRWAERCPKSSKGKAVVAMACTCNLGILFAFKYLAWLIESFGWIGEDGIWAGIELPIGISFYTFQALSYVIDIYRGKERAQKNILNVGLYISFFPQLIAGPIVRYGTIAKQLQNRKHSFDLFSEGAERFIVGLSKKLLLANQLAALADISFGRNAAERSAALAWAGALAFMLQIYFDFSGYSDMAIGLGKMFGFAFPENFNYPYISRSVAEYWRRWHISLGEWFRDYLYYPLSLGPAIKVRRAAQKKCGRKAAGMVGSAFVLFIVWLATGVWHGANWTFVIWGLMQFVFIYWEQYRKPFKDKRLRAAIGFVSTFLFVLLSKVIFRADSVEHALSYYASMLHLSGNTWKDAYSLYWIGQYKAFLVLGLLLSFPILEWVKSCLRTDNAQRIWHMSQMVMLIVLLCIDICYAVGGGYNPFIYFNF